MNGSGGWKRFYAGLLRRSQIYSERRITIGSTVLDCDSLTVSFGGTDTSLPQKEFLLLFRLLSSMNRIFTRRQLMDELWGLDSEADPTRWRYTSADSVSVSGTTPILKSLPCGDSDIRR